MEEKSCLLKFTKEGDIDVTFVGMWQRRNVDQCYSVMLRELPGYNFKLRQKLDKERKENENGRGEETGGEERREESRGE